MSNYYQQPGSSPMDFMRQQTHGGHFGGYPQQGGYGYHGGYNEPHRGAQGDFMEEIREMAHGRKPIPDEFKAIICAVVKEQTDSMLGQYGYTQHGGQHGGEQHIRYKETLEELRDIPNVTEAVKRASQYFDDLTEEDKKVLQQILNRPSYKKMAQMVNMTPERFMEVKRDLERKLKR
jgi:hypothetical protein